VEPDSTGRQWELMQDDAGFNLTFEELLTLQEVEERLPEALAKWRRGDRSAYIDQYVHDLATNAIPDLDSDDLFHLHAAARMVKRFGLEDSSPLHRVLVTFKEACEKLEVEMTEA